MSKPTIIATQCPHCNTSIDFPYYEDVNVTKNPELKAAILSGDFFKYTCPNCKKTIPTVGPLLYHDPEIPALYYLNPPNFDQSTDKLDEMLETITTFEGSNASHYQARLVSSVDKLLEKIYIQEAGLDDRVVELVKLVYLKHYANELQAQGPVRSTLFRPKTDTENTQIIFFLGKENHTASIDFSKEYYDYFVSEYENQLNDTSSPSKFEKIDENWALNFLK